ncbi:TdiB protein [Diaporthe sp. PMI_573]|nr:TdiB protein [Diaporthaceae sp. PMI_573]
MLSRIKPEMRDIDLGWAEQFVEALFPSNEEEMARVLERSRTELPPPLDHALTFNMAVDLRGGARSMKAYMFPMAKNLASGRDRDARDAGLDAIRNLKPYGDRLAPAVDFLDSYWDQFPERLTLDMIGMDCIDPSKARIKIYAHISARNSWKVVRDFVTFGGQATDPERLKGLDLLRSIWNLLRNEQGPVDDDFDKPLRHPTSFLGSIMFSFEIVPGRQIPDVKVYVPMWQYAPSDGHVARNLISAFRELGWQQTAEKYMTGLRHTFPGADLDSPLSVVHSNISFSFTEKTGAYMSVYYAVSGKATLSNSQAERKEK